MNDRTRETVRYRARFDECNADGVLRLSGLMRWAQDCAWVHSERLGFGRGWYAERGLWWLVRCATLTAVDRVPLGETVAVTTRVSGWRRVWARRQSMVGGDDGRPIATVLTDWVLTDSRGMPTRVPPEFGEIFGAVESFEPARVSLEPTPAHVTERRFEVRGHETDPMAHANNAAYVDWIEDAARLAGLGPLRRLRLEYVAPAALDDGVVERIWRRADAAIGYRLEREAGTELLRAIAEP